MGSQKKTVIVALVIASTMMIAGVLALIQSQKTIPSSGTITSINLGVFQEVSCVNPYDDAHPISWGSLDPSVGQHKDVIVYLKNSGTTDMTLKMDPSVWSPIDADTYLALTWNLGVDTTTITAGQSGLAATLTLTVTKDFTTETPIAFSVNVVITGTHNIS